MKKTTYTAMALGLGLGMVLTAGSIAGNSFSMAQGMMNGDQMMRKGMMGKGMMRRHKGMGRHQGNRIRHRVIMMGAGLPVAYREIANPLPASAENRKAGKALYTEQCVSCHGVSGKGDGLAGKELDPKPANIAFVMDKPIATDGFLFWAISDGGVDLKTAMPAFKDVLDEKERWQIIHYLRTGLVSQ